MINSSLDAIETFEVTDPTQIDAASRDYIATVKIKMYKTLNNVSVHGYITWAKTAFTSNMSLFVVPWAHIESVDVEFPIAVDKSSGGTTTYGFLRASTGFFVINGANVGTSTVRFNFSYVTK